MKVKKAVITAAGPNQRKLPLQTLIDSDGMQKSVLEILIEEVIQAGAGNNLCQQKIQRCKGHDRSQVALPGEQS